MGEIQLSEKEYDTLQAVNKQHGRTVFCDLHVATTYGADIFVAPPRILPSSVRPNRADIQIAPLAFRAGRKERIEVVKSALDGETIQYEKVFDEEGRLRSLRRDGGIFSGSIPPTGSHYHLLSLDHGGRVSVYRATLGLGDNLDSYQHLFDSLNRELLAYLKEITEERTAYMGQRVPADLGVSMLRAYTMGFRQAAQEFLNDEVVDKADSFLDRLPH